MRIPIDASIMDAAQKLTGSVDELLAFLRQAGVSQMRSSLALMQLRSLPEGEAKQSVIDSPVWRAERPAVVSLHDDLAADFALDRKPGPRP